MKSVLKFENNQPREIVLAFAQGKVTPSNFGAAQVMYTLADPPDTITFLDLTASQKINQLRAAQGERLVICKRKGAERNAPVRWDVWLANDTEKARAAQEAGIPLKDGRPAWGGKPAAADPHSQLERELAASVADATRKRTEEAVVQPAVSAPAVTVRPAMHGPLNADCANSTASGSRVATRLENALKAAVAAAYAATEYARSIGYASMPLFTSDDLTKMATALMSDAAKQGGSR